MTDVTVDTIVDANDANGIFDTLMTAVEVRLKEQFDANRITGQDYANIYLGAMESAMAQSVALALGAVTANKQADLLTQQILTEVENTLRMNAETAGVVQNTALTLAQTNKVNAEELLVDQQLLTEVQKTLLTTANTTLATAQGVLTSQQNLSEIQNTALITANTANVNATTTLTTNKAATELSNNLGVVSNTAKTDNETIRIASETTLLGNKNLTEVQTTGKVTEEKLLLAQKVETEKAQIDDTPTGGLVGTDFVTGIVGAQRLLYEAQKDGFARDAEQKLLKIMYDGWAVFRSTATDAPALPTEGGDPGINAVLVKTKAGVGVV